MKLTAKRILSLVLCLAMLVGMFPAFAMGADAAETVLDAAIFCSDVHGSTSDLTSVLSGVKTSGVDYSSIGFVGDTCLTVANTTSTVQSALGDTDIAVMFSYAASHDTENSADISTNWNYSGEVADISDYYLVYTIRETDMQNASDAATAAPAFTTWYSGLTDAQKALPIFIMSHRPLHARRGDNAGASAWYSAISAAAESSDIVFFWAHNHTEETSVDQAAYYVAKDGDETFTVYNGATVTPNFTYMNAGYINANNQNPGRINVATTVQITADSLIFQDYTTSGTYTDFTYSHNVTVTREFAATEESSEPTTEETTTESTEGSTEEASPESESALPAPTTATVTGATTTESKTVYVLVSTPTAGNQYIIASSGSAGSAYALKENTTTGSSVTINAAANGISAPWIETSDEAIMWNAASGMTFQSENGGYYLRQTQSSGSRSLSFSTSQSTNWTVGTNTLSYKGNRNSYYVSGGSTWSLSSSSANIYFYEKQTVTVTTSANGTYSIAGKDVTKVVVEGSTAALSSTLTFVPESGTTTTTDTSSTATYTVYSDESDIIDDNISGNTVTFTGNYGTAVVKVSYTVTINGTDYPVDNYITVTATEPYYTLDITKGDTVVSGSTISQKGVTSSTTLQLGTQITYTTEEGTTTLTELPEGATLTWAIPAEYQNIATVDENGLVSFKGVDGAFYVMVTLTINGKDYTTGVNISATTSQYSVPSDGTTDFPEYPNEGAIRYDKTATAVGVFSETGIAKLELSMTGVPYTTDNAMDVVVMLDMTGSMSDNGMSAAEEATVAFVEKIVKNTDGSYNSNRVAVYAFNSGSSSPYELVSLKSITSDDELTTANTAIRTASDKQTSGGTPYDDSMKTCYDVLNAAKTDGIGNDRSQFLVYMSDGGPTEYLGVSGNTWTNTSSDTYYIANNWSISDSSSANWTFSLEKEYYSEQLKAAGVTIYTVGLLLQNVPSNPSPYSSMSASTVTDGAITSMGTHYFVCSNILKQMATDESKYIDIFSVDTADDATAKFSAIASQILEAATDVVVTDKVADEYTMIFDVPTGSQTINGLDDQEFYIEFLEYALDENHERTTSTSKLKLYLGSSNGTYYAASDATGTAFADPVFTAVATDDDGNATEKGYYSIVDSTYTAQAGEIVINVNGTSYKFIEDGSGDYNMTSGAYAYGTIDSTTNMADDLVIVTPYFAYSAATRMLAWTVEKLTTVEYALTYFLYLDNSATEVGTDAETDSGPYPTNDWAYITYTNFNGNDCRQEFPIPQLTWNGAQVSYVFYLVNEAGQPINKSGQVVDFANATFITDVYTQHVVWNRDGSQGETELNVEYLADDLLPDDYIIYDENAHYTIHVYQDSTGSTIFDYFIIEGSAEGTVNAENGNTVNSDDTTKVYNTKAGTKYSEYGTYSADAVGSSFEATDASGNQVTIVTTHQASLDYSDTTVAFAVLWKPALVEDVVVVDFGLDVLINVVQNDNLQNTVSGIGLGKDAYGTTAMNTGVVTTAKLGTAALTTDDGSTISIENENQIRFHQNDMTFSEPITFYYESSVEFYENSEPKEGYMYSSVTVIPATTIYYEDDFVDYVTTGTAEWVTVGSTVTATQDQDRPGAAQISKELDADNNYGYDSAYETMSQYSMGSARKVTVSSGNAGRASFTFYGTGFDVISLTDNMTGTIIVKVYSGSSASGTLEKSLTVDTYYGYAYDSETDTWYTVDSNSPNALYQVPVMKVSGLDYGQHYVTITASYQSLFDHNTVDTYTAVEITEFAEGTTYYVLNEDGTYTAATEYVAGTTYYTVSTAKLGSYDFYLDAIRIYDPTGNQDADANAAYVKDGEGWPIYKKLRSLIIAADSFGSYVTVDSTDYSKTTTVEGVVFIDSANASGAGTTNSIADYTSYGPNNELYLAPGQAVAFQISDAFVKTGTTTAITPVDVQLAIKTVGGSADIEIFNPGISSETKDNGDGTATTTYTAIKDNLIAETLNSATDMYYSIGELTGDTIVISNAGTSGILSITNIKFTFTESAAVSTVTTTNEETGEEEVSEASVASISEAGAVYSLRSLSAYSVSETVETETEATEPETTEPETGATEPETTEPETEATEPETTEPEAEATEPETTEPEEDSSTGSGIGSFLEWLFGWIFG